MSEGADGVVERPSGQFMGRRIMLSQAFDAYSHRNY